ncbi:Semaphorin-5B-like, protein [Aphelenchoides bicaudatus]|nr:Semaphorin-5B-like, protein [Aphelenchoides bicaudatus]
MRECSGVNWGSWGTWSQCSVNCGGGLRSRSRSCPILNVCAGPAFEQSKCNEHPMLYHKCRLMDALVFQSSKDKLTTNFAGLIGLCAQFHAEMALKEERVHARPEIVLEQIVKQPTVTKEFASDHLRLRGAVSQFYALQKMRHQLDHRSDHQLDHRSEPHKGQIHFNQDRSLIWL